MANLLGHVLALLDINLSTLPVRIVDISANLLGNLFAIFLVNGLTLRMRNLLQENELILDAKLSLWEMNNKARYSVLGKSYNDFIDRAQRYLLLMQLIKPLQPFPKSL